jgi:hypothetical protein
MVKDEQAPAAPKVEPKKQGYVRGGRGRGAMKFTGSMRGRGVLVSAVGETPVTYQIDVYESGAGRTGSGTLDGDMGALTIEEAGDAAKLRLSTGDEVGITLSEVDPEGAMMEVKGTLPPA